MFTYTIPLTGGCGTVNATGTITVNPAPANISITGTTTTCAGIPVNVTLTATPGTQLTWNGTPSTITIGASGSNVISVSPAATTSYEIVSADLNGCAIPVTGQIATVTVSATPQFINQIAELANLVNHHPSILNNYNVVEIWLCTHDENNQITAKDHELANMINEIK